MVTRRLSGEEKSTQFFIGLGGTEQIGGQLSAAHVVKNFLVRFQPLAGVNVAHSQAAI